MLKWFERKARVTTYARIGVEAETLEEAEAKFEAFDYTEYDTIETVEWEWTTDTVEIG